LNANTCLRLVSARLAELDDAWTTGTVYLNRNRQPRGMPTAAKTCRNGVPHRRTRQRNEKALLAFGPKGLDVLVRPA